MQGLSCASPIVQRLSAQLASGTITTAIVTKKIETNLYLLHLAAIWMSVLYPQPASVFFFFFFPFIRLSPRHRILSLRIA